ncbi:MAG: 2-dehydropantoate 2-reductase, partial [Peptoniphilaceae bacterium]|nr:2-dehydropantoate 2-reductase [Peptoniphilaceae bacterium]
MLVYIAGSGAMGSTIGYHIEKNTDSQVILLDYWQDHIDKINENGLKVSGKVEDTIKIKAMRPEEAKEKADLIVVMTKSMALENMMEAIEGIIGDNTQILCLLNGMGHEKILEKFLDKSQINMGVTIWAAGLTGPGEIEITSKGTIDVQNIGDDEKNGRKIADLLDKAGLGAKYDTDVMYAIWRKVMVNGT